MSLWGKEAKGTLKGQIGTEAGGKVMWWPEPCLI